LEVLWKFLLGDGNVRAFGSQFAHFGGDKHLALEKFFWRQIRGANGKRGLADAALDITRSACSLKRIALPRGAMIIRHPKAGFATFDAAAPREDGQWRGGR